MNWDSHYIVALVTLAPLLVYGLIPECCELRPDLVRIDFRIRNPYRVDLD